VLSNPPYVAVDDPHWPALRHEPRQALIAGVDGLSELRRIAASARQQLTGWLLLEHGWNQAEAVHDLLAQEGFIAIETRRDLHGHRRCTGGRRP
jgi:release factor glutamine methyltransferase